MPFISSTSLRIASTSGPSPISASSSLKRVRMVRRSCETPASIAVRCSIERSMRPFISMKDCAAWRISRAPRGRKSGASRPLPKLSAASASRRIGRIWLRRNSTATVSRTTDVPIIQNRKISEFDAYAALRWANTRITASSSLILISTSDERPTVSIQNGRPTFWLRRTDNVWSSSEKNGFGPGAGMSVTGRKSTIRPSRVCAMTRSRSLSCGYMP